MSYLDPKERVIDLKLTSYGRHLLAKGKLEPVYYAFFDDDIIYDGEYASIEENLNNVESRIQEETPRLAAQAVFSSRETAVFEATPNIINDMTIGQDIEMMTDKEKQAFLTKTRIQESPEKTRLLQQPIGKSNSTYSNNPAWNIRFLQAPLSGSTEFLEFSSSSGVYYQDIPQLSVDIQYYIERNSPEYNNSNNSNFVNFSNNEEVDGPQYAGDNNRSGMEGFFIEPLIFENGATINAVAGMPVLLRLEESFTFFQNENFDIECFEVETVDGEEKLIPMKYYKQNENDEVRGILEKDDIGAIDQYFDVMADEEIPLNLVCPVLRKDTSRQFFHQKIFDCEPYNNLDPVDSYTELEDTEDICE